MTSIEQFFSDRAANDPCFCKSVFVFPSQIPADLWANRLLMNGVCSTIPAESFISWDTFKESVVQTYQADSVPVSSIVRDLYAMHEMADNAAALNKHGTPIYHNLIPHEFCSESSIFAQWFARLLPQLGTWERYYNKSGAHFTNGDYSADNADLQTAYDRYSAFLQQNHFFEPSWKLPDLNLSGKRYYIFFPRTIDDFIEYEYELRQSPVVEFKEFSTTTDISAAVYGTSRQEISATVQKIRYLLTVNKVTMDQIAVSLPDIDAYAPYFLRELSLYDIPFKVRTGNTLGAAPGGVLFQLIKDCVDSHFSFESVKSLLLNRQIPWKKRGACESIIERGIAFHCVTSWKENGAYIDIWNSALQASAVNTSDADLIRWFNTLVSCLTSLAGADSFAKVRNQYFKLRELFIDKDAFAPECDLVISRCIEELSGLIDIESKYPNLCPPRPYDFFVSHIGRKKYVISGENTGISIFPYKVAAGIPVQYHFVCNACQEQTTVIYGTLQFLRADERSALHVPSDNDVSGLFFDAYQAGVCSGSLCVSCSERTFSGYATLHNVFAASAVQAQYIPDVESIDRECERFYCFGTSLLPAVSPPVLFSVQKEVFPLWLQRHTAKKIDVAVNPMDKSILSPFLSRSSIMDGPMVLISATQLLKFFTCPLQWYYGTLLRLKEFSLDSKLIDERNIGSIIHYALNLLYEKVKATSPNGCFCDTRLDDYKSFVPDCVQKAFNSQKEFTGPLSRPLVQALFDRTVDTLTAELEFEASSDLNGLYIDMLETQLEVSQNDMKYIGIIDRVSLGADGSIVILDYKTGLLPTIKSCICIDDTLNNYQIASYIFLVEQSCNSGHQNAKVDIAAFLGVGLNTTARSIVGTLQKRTPCSRNEYDISIAAFCSDAEKMRDAVTQADFSFTNKKEPLYQTCYECPYRMVCRHLYAVQ